MENMSIISPLYQIQIHILSLLNLDSLLNMKLFISILCVDISDLF